MKDKKPTKMPSEPVVKAQAPDVSAQAANAQARMEILGKVFKVMAFIVTVVGIICAIWTVTHVVGEHAQNASVIAARTNVQSLPTTTVNTGTALPQTGGEFQRTPKGLTSQYELVIAPGEKKSFRDPNGSADVTYEFPHGKLVHVAWSDGDRVGLIPQADHTVKRLSEYDVQAGVVKMPAQEGASWVCTFTNKDTETITITVVVLWKS